MGYLSKDGPNSFIRELGAIPLNAAEICLILGLGTLWFTRRYEGLFRNRKIYKRMFSDPTNVALTAVKKEIKEENEAVFSKWRKSRSLLPMHPTIMKGKTLPGEKGYPG